MGALRGNDTRVEQKGIGAALQARQEKPAKYRAQVLPLIKDKQRQGAQTLRAIAAALNSEGTPAPRGGEWSATQVRRILRARSDR